MNLSPGITDLTAEWQKARILYPMYAALSREFVVEMPRCNDLEAGVEAPPKESVEQARRWFEEMDQRIQVHQLRQFLQTTTLTSDRGLRTLLEHHLGKKARTDSDRDKIDFLLVQYFSHCAPSRLDDSDVDLAYVAETLEMVLGKVDLKIPEWLAPLDELLTAAGNCKNLNQLLTSRILEKGRKIKTSAGEKYYLPVAMVAFSRFSFMMRRAFFRLMHQDLNAILDGLRQLEQLGVATLDCRSAQFSAEEPTVRLRMICQSWKVMFHAEYSSGQPLRMLVDLQAIIKTALASAARKNAAGGGKSTATASHTKAAGSGVKHPTASSAVAEFEISSNANGWDPDGNSGPV